MLEEPAREPAGTGARELADPLGVGILVVVTRAAIARVVHVAPHPEAFLRERVYDHLLRRGRAHEVNERRHS